MQCILYEPVYEKDEGDQITVIKLARERINKNLGNWDDEIVIPLHNLLTEIGCVGQYLHRIIPADIHVRD